MWKSQPVQTFFSGPNQVFFPVQSTSRIVSKSAVSTSLKRVLEAAKADDGNASIRDNVIRSNPNVRTERSPWLNRTEWLETFLDKDIKALTDHASVITRNPIEQAIAASVKRVINDSLAGIKDLRKRGWGIIRFWLRSVDAEEPHEKPFRMYYSDLRSYTSYWTRLMLFCQRTEGIEDGVQLDTEQAGILRRLEGAVSNPDPNRSRSEWEESIDVIMLEFTVSLIKHSNFKPELSAIKYFCGVMGYNSSEHRWKQPGEYTNFLAGIQFGIRVFSLESCLPTRERNDYNYRPEHENTGETPLLRFRKFHREWLVMAEACPFTWVHDLMNYGISASINERGKATVDFSDDGKWVQIHGHPFEISKYKSMIDSVVRRAETILSRELLFRDSDTIDPINPYEIHDDECMCTHRLATDHSDPGRGPLLRQPHRRLQTRGERNGPGSSGRVTQTRDDGQAQSRRQCVLRER